MYGTTRPIVKRAILDGLASRLAATEVSLRYQTPEITQDLVNDAGEHDAIWIDEPDTPGIEVVPHMRTPPHDFDEEYDLIVHVQCLRPESDGSQEATDLRAAELLAEVGGLIASNPDLVPKSDNFPYCEITRAGVLPNLGMLKAGHGTEYGLVVHVKARIANS